MDFRLATLDDCGLLAKLNEQLIQDEGHRIQLTRAGLERRVREWLSEEYRAALFSDQEQVVAYALYRERADEIYLRQFFVARDRRRQGLGRQAFDLLRSQIWPTEKRLTVDVLSHNSGAIAFWRAVGYRDYCLTLEMLP